jgi:hypothetical protein
MPTQASRSGNSGANIASLRQGQANFREFGASEMQFVGEVRPPWPDEMPPE